MYDTIKGYVNWLVIDAYHGKIITEQNAYLLDYGFTIVILKHLKCYFISRT